MDVKVCTQTYVVDHVGFLKLSLNEDSKKDTMILGIGGQLQLALEPDSPASSLLSGASKTKTRNH